MNVLALSVTEPGRRLAERLPYAHQHGQAGRTFRERWNEVDAFVAVLAVGATVRLIAPLLASKERDPAVVCVDDAGEFAVVVCGGHARAGNQLAAEVAGVLDATPVVTTATDRLEVAALDQLPGLTPAAASGHLAAATAALLAGDRVEVHNPHGWPLPEPLAREAGREAGPFRARLVVTDRVLPVPDDGGAGRPVPVVVLHPRSLVVGIGTSSDAGPEEAASAVQEALDEAGLADASVAELATVDRRARHPAVLALARARGATIRTFDPATLAAVAVPNPSERVRDAVGTPSVAEAAALAAAGPGGNLVVPKTRFERVTVAVARRARPGGSVAVVGLGPGGPAHRTPAATAAVRHADLVVGYQAYLDQCRDLLNPAQELAPYPLGAELARARAALGAATAGRRVALVCSGDPGVYAMASPLLELVDETGPDGLPLFPGVEVSVVPGVTASLAVAAALGAPLGHDHAVVSLSDLHTPWKVIEARVAAAGAADYVLVLYNPRSRRRTWQLERARSVLLRWRSPETPVGLVHEAARNGEQAVLTTLAELPSDQVSMATCVVIGSSTTRVVAGRMVTPRGYDR